MNDSPALERKERKDAAATNLHFLLKIKSFSIKNKRIRILCRKLMQKSTARMKMMNDWWKQLESSCNVGVASLNPVHVIPL